MPDSQTRRAVRRIRTSAAALAAILFPALSLAASPETIFRETIQPVLKRECLGCHGAGQVLAKLDLRSREGLMQGGQRGPAVKAGRAEETLLYRALTGKDNLSMPPGGPSKRLSPDVLAAFKTWIEAGVPWSEEQAEQKWHFKEEDVWALRPLRKADPPAGAASPIDGFLIRAMKARGLSPAPHADRRTLIRRVTFDLTGLPPAPEEIDAFVQDRSPDAWRKLVERLLASPRYGERWARHWLDVVRYGDTSGYSNDFERPNAWRYRDYVIRAFNQDKPYDQFIREQIAGDELDPNNGELRIATGFLRAGPWEHTAMSVEAVTRQMWLDDVTGAVGATFLGLTTGCARCHDHKFDPIPTRDYYSLQAVFAGTEFARPAVPFAEYENVRDFAFGKAALRQAMEQTQSRMAAIKKGVRARIAVKRGVGADQVSESDMSAAMAEGKEMTPDEFEEFKLHQKHAQLYRESLDRFEPKAFAVSSGPLDGFTDGGPALKYPKAAEYKPQPVRVLVGGSLQSPAETVAPGVLSAVERYSGLKPPAFPTGAQGRRMALANWIANPANPLTARVMVNRIWQAHFGTGLAADTNNLGTMGRKPAHPELLDWLASHFIQQGWSVKELHRTILLSEAYRRGGSHPAMTIVRDKDPNNELLTYYPPRRLEAEVLRDSILAVAGELSVEAGGPGAFPQINEDVARQPRHAMGSLQPAYFASPQKRLRNRRTIYMFQQRSLVDPLVEVFNGPNADFSCERREASTVPTQAFALFNSEFANDMALALAARADRDGGDRSEKLVRAFRLALGREPRADERKAALLHWDRMAALHRRTQPPPRPARRPVVHTITSELTGEQFRFVQSDSPADYEYPLHPSEVAAETRALADIALALLNSNEFIYVY
jgi:hypothetical protein